MNEPIISPWIFYALFVVDNLKSALVLSMIICASAIVFMPMIVAEEDFGKYAKRIVILFIISGLLMVVTPDSKTVTQMLVSQYVTRNNIEKAGQFTERAIDKIIEKVINASIELNKKKNDVNAR